MSIEITDYIFLPAIIFFGTITSLEDYRFGKIKNRWIVAGLLYGAIAFSLLFLWSEFIKLLNSHNYQFLNIIDIKGVFSFIIPIEYFAKVLLNSISALLISFFLWRYGLLAAGDAKLFFLFSFLLPLKYYWRSYLPLFPSFSLFANIFLPVFVYIILRAVIYNIKNLVNINFRQEKSLKQEVAKRKEKIIEFAKTFFTLIIIFIIMSKLLFLTGPFLPPFMKNSAFNFAIFIILNRIFSKYFKNKKVYLISILVLLSFVIYDYINLGAELALLGIFASFKTSAQFMLLFMFIQYMTGEYLKMTARRKIGVEDLKPSMFLGVDKKVMPQIGSITGGGMSLEQVEMVKGWCTKNNLKEIEVYKKFPFAIWIFMGVIITIFFKESLIVLFLNLLK